MLGAQHPYYYSINDDNGLPSNEVYDLLQDEFGFMWIGTNSGLYRYDGTDFIPIQTNGQTGRAISHIIHDASKRLWCQNFSGLIFSVDGDSLKQEIDWRSRQANFPTFDFGDNNSVWLSSDSGLYCLTGKKEIHFPPESINGQHSRTIFLDIRFFQNKLYYTEEKAIGYIQQGKAHIITKTNRPEFIQKNRFISSLHEVGKRTLVISRTENLNSIWEIRNDSLLWLLDLPSSLGRVFSMYNDGRGRLWIGSTGGALCLNYQFEIQFNGRCLFPGKSISDVLLDKEGNYWFSTLHDGIFVVPSTEVWISTAENSVLADTRVRQLTKDNSGNIYIGYQSGKVSRLNHTSKQISTISFENSPTEIQAMYLDTESRELLVAQNKTWLIKTDNMQVEPVKGISNIKSLTRLAEKTYLIGTVTGTYQIGLKPTVNFEKRLRNHRTRAVFVEEKLKQQWVCYNDGVWVNDSELKWQGSSIHGTDVAQTQDGIIWIGTLTNGVLGFMNGNVATQLGAEIGIVNGFVRKLAAQGNQLWIVAESSLICYNVQERTFVRYNRFDGLPSLEINDIEFVNGSVLLATPKGLVEIPERFGSANTIPPSVFVSGVAIHEKDTALSAEYKLAFADNNLRITFKGIAFRSHGQFTYKYRLLGLDSAWITTNSAANFARYPSLPSGKYLFEVLALNEDGVPSTKPATVRIEVMKPFWQKWWFYTLCGLLLVAIVSFVFVLRIRQLRRRNELEKRMANSQLSALKSQMNPHFMFNALNSIQDLVLQQDTANAQLYLGKFSELTRKVLDASGTEFISLHKEIEMLALYLDLEKLRFGNEMTYHLGVSKAIEPDEAELPSMIIQPFVENALKHGLLHQQGEKVLRIEFLQTKNALVCVVEDNGIGRKASAEINARKKRYQSFATNATAERLRLLNEYYGLKIELQIQDMEQGTKVTVTIPEIQSKL